MPQYVRVPYKGKKDGTYVNGIQINQPCGDTDEMFEICFDKNQVGGTQSQGTIGLVDSYGNGAACVVQDTLPDFCGGVTPEPTKRPTNRPTTPKPTNKPTKRPTTPEPTPRPTPYPTTASYDPSYDIRNIVLSMYNWVDQMEPYLLRKFHVMHSTNMYHPILHTFDLP